MNPLRIYDCKVEACRQAVQGAPSILEGLCRACVEHLENVKEHLSLLGVPFSTNPFIVRGLDYYRRTTFEVLSGALGAQNAVCGGGRYDGLIEELGGPDLPGIGFAIGEERLVSILGQKGLVLERPPELFVAALGEKATKEAFLRVEQARRAGIKAEMDLRGGSLKAQLRRADKLGARRVLILGEKELATGRAPLRDMLKASQVEIQLDQLEQVMAGWGKGPDVREHRG